MRIYITDKRMIQLTKYISFLNRIINHITLNEFIFDSYFKAKYCLICLYFTLNTLLIAPLQMVNKGTKLKDADFNLKLHLTQFVPFSWEIY
jgi:hypothetical protein